VKSNQRILKTVEPKIFISYAKEDRAKVKKLYQRLKNEQLTPWIDMEDLLPGDDWERTILGAIRSAHFVIVFLSKHSINKRGYVQKEIKEALDLADRMPDGQIFIIPVRLNDCIVPERLVKWQWVDIYLANGFTKLVKTIRNNLKPNEFKKPTSRNRRESIISQKQRLDSTLIEFIRDGGLLAYGKLGSNHIAISNGHILDVFSAAPDWLAQLTSEISVVQRISPEVYERLITTGDKYRQEKYMFSTSQKHKKKKFAQVLTTRGGIKCGVQAKYFNYMLERHLEADIYIRSEKDAIIYERDGAVCGILMPFLLDKK
jgi:hypothetical protein